uniref:putative rRNA methylase YtqB n=1 Tax=Erigeron canadensis TaxID=72917 RepID=UPI001CB99C97|nr:putative rRNA methylase YtqB [Erigeron canadensis]
MMRCTVYPVVGRSFHKSSISCSPILNFIWQRNSFSISAGACSSNNYKSATDSSPLSGLESVMLEYIFGKKKATQVAHSIWKHVVQKGDIVVDATCGNGYDTLAMVYMVADKSCTGRVYSMDIQETALQNTTSLLDKLLDPDEKEIVDLSIKCHSKMEEVVPRGIMVRLVAFNLGYLPGGDKTIITNSKTTLLGMEAASRIIASGGLISLLVYVGHPGGMEEYKMVEEFASRLPVNEWICCKLQMLNRPLAPIVVLLCKR